MQEQITLGAGCFWCIEAALGSVRGVTSAISGYMGGSAADANYQAVCSGTTGHVEVVQLSYDSDIVDIKLLLEMFLFLHDATSWDRQGNDVGSQYRSVWFYHTPYQAQVAEQLISSLNQTDAYAQEPIVTQIRQAETFYPAEAYHQQYVTTNPNQPYCALLVAPKLKKFRQEFANYL